jgi:hypothetical protein
MAEGNANQVSGAHGMIHRSDIEAFCRSTKAHFRAAESHYDVADMAEDMAEWLKAQGITVIGQTTQPSKDGKQ